LRCIEFEGIFGLSHSGFRLTFTATAAIADGNFPHAVAAVPGWDSLATKEM